MIRYTIFIFISICTYSQVFASCVGSSPTWTTDGNEAADVAECITASSARDTINVIAGDGTADWGAASVVIPDTKALAIIGPGASALSVTLIGDEAVVINDTASRISGFSFTSPEDAGRTAIDAQGQGWRVDNCTYINIVSTNNLATSPTGIFVLAEPVSASDGHPYGLIDNNTIYNGKVVVMGGTNFLAQSTIWAEESLLGNGSSAVMYVEKNLFSATATDQARLSIDANYAGRYVFRYNVVENGYVLTHGLQQYGYRGTRAFEIYGNTFKSLSGYTYFMISLKSGEGVSFYNQELSSATPYDVVTQVLHERDADDAKFGTWDYCDGFENIDGNTDGGWLCRDQLGAGKDASVWADPATSAPTQSKAPLYFWSTKDQAGDYQVTYRYNAGAMPVVSDRDFYDYDSTFDGTTGTGCGTLAARPATCTAGVGYWATNQSCSDLTGMVGASPSTPIAGTLYKCTSTNTWTAYYTPYQYPHPLRGTHYSLQSGNGSLKSGNGQFKTR